MKLSEAGRLGATLGTQISNEFFDSAEGQCYLGGTVLATGGWRTMGHTEVHQHLDSHFPSLELPIRNLPCGCSWTGQYSGLAGIPKEHQVLEVAVSHLNDHHNWTFNQISDWVEMVEEKAEAAEKMLEKVEQPQVELEEVLVRD